MHHLVNDNLQICSYFLRRLNLFTWNGRFTIKHFADHLPEYRRKFLCTFKFHTWYRYPATSRIKSNHFVTPSGYPVDICDARMSSWTSWYKFSSWCTWVHSFWPDPNIRQSDPARPHVTNKYSDPTRHSHKQCLSSSYTYLSNAYVYCRKQYVRTLLVSTNTRLRNHKNCTNTV